MTLEQLFDSFVAFNANSVNSLIYLVKTNLWLLLSVAGALTIIVMGLKDEIDDYVAEEQNII